jgi:hypothetical protein
LFKSRNKGLPSAVSACIAHQLRRGICTLLGSAADDLIINIISDLDSFNLILSGTEFGSLTTQTVEPYREKSVKPYLHIAKTLN